MATTLLLLLACTGATTDSGLDTKGIGDSAAPEDTSDTSGTSDTSDTVESGTGEGCGSAAPVFDYADVSLADDGQLRFDAYFSDTDADLNVVVLDTWYDDVVDGNVDTSGDAPISTGEQVLQSGSCTLANGALAFEIPVDGTPFASGTTYEFALIVFDQDGHGSTAFIDAQATPAE